MKIIFQNAQVVVGGTISKNDVAVENGIIGAIAPAGSLQGGTIRNVEGLYLSHGFIDMHVHGGAGHDFMDATEEAWNGAATLHLKHGTTALLATTLAAEPEELLATLETYQMYKRRFRGGAKILGLHIEGPYLSPAQSGAQDPAHIRNPNPAEYKALVEQCPDILRWTIAPECAGALDMGDFLAGKGIVPCIGHSNATYEETKNALLHGYRHITHLYSATSTIVRKKGFRHAGIVESAYLLDGLSSEVIADGCHLPAPLLQMAYRFIGPDRLCLVTDAMRAAGQNSGESILGSLNKGQRVILEDGVAKMPDRNAFAGSICTADRLVRNMMMLGNAPLADAIKMITETPARILGLSASTGLLAVGRAADLVLFDEDINIHSVLLDGTIQ